jgi:hypothetical protein
MGQAPKPLTGRCLCGGVTYTADADPVAQAACHCTDCQRQTSSPFSIVVGVPMDALTVEGDTLASYSTTGSDHGSQTERKFCSACGSPLFSVSGAMPQVAFLKAGSLDDASWIEPGIEVWTDSAQPWAPHFDGVPQLARGPG